MKKTYIAPKSTDYKVEAIAPIATSGNSLKMEDRVTTTDLTDDLDNQFTKNNNAWDEKW